MRDALGGQMRMLILRTAVMGDCEPLRVCCELIPRPLQEQQAPLTLGHLSSPLKKFLKLQPPFPFSFRCVYVCIYHVHV